MLLVFFNLSNVSHSAIANSCPAVPAAASRVAMSTAAVITVLGRSAPLSWGLAMEGCAYAWLMLTPNRDGLG